MTSAEEERPEEFAAMAELADAFTDLVEVFTQRRALSLRVHDLVGFGQRCMPRAQHAGLTVLEGGQVRTVAASSATAQRLDEIRAVAGPEQCPVPDVLEVNDLVTSGDLSCDPRWPAFGVQAVHELGVYSLASYRLYLGPDSRAALTFLSEWPHAFDQLAVAIGAIFAAYGSLALLNQTVLSDALPTSPLAEVHREIGVALGILLEGGRVSSQEAYQRLHQTSLRLGQSMHRVARHVIDHFHLPPEDVQ